MSFCVYVFMNTINDGAKSKPHSQRRSILAIYMRKNTYIKTWRLKRREGICSKGAYFWELTLHACTMRKHSS